MISFKFSALKESKPYEIALRFVFGGMCTVLAHVVAQRWGPVIGGFFLAFPAIFPASATLIATHEERRKTNAGLHGAARGRLAAAVDAAGAVIGCIGLAGFAAVVWYGLPRASGYIVIPAATVVWTTLSTSLWFARKRGLIGSAKL